MNINALGAVFTLALAYIVAYHSTSAVFPFVLVLMFAAFSAMDLPDFEENSFKEMLTWVLIKPILVAACATAGLIGVALGDGASFHVAYIALGVSVIGLFLLGNLLAFSLMLGRKVALDVLA